MKYARVLGPAVLSVFLAAQAWGQFTLRGGLSGMITDASKAVIPNVTVTLTDLERNQKFTAKTNESGLYAFTNLTPGQYQVTVEQPGFRKAVSSPISISEDQTARLDLLLEVGGQTESVEVNAAPQSIQAQESVVGITVNQELVASVPMKGLNYTAVAVLAPGLSVSPNPNSGSTYNVGANNVIAGVQYTVGGGGDNGFFMNGVNINENWQGGPSYSPSAEAVSEIKLDVTNFTAAAGRDATTLQVTTRSGTDQYHATGFEYFQNSALNAWNPYSKALAAPGQKMNLLQRSQFGGNLGGPVVIPKVYNGRNKFFFFVNYERLHENDGGAGALYRVPTAAERQGDYSSWLTRFSGSPSYIVYNPFSTIVQSNGNTTRTPFPNNVIPSSSINTQAQEMLNLYPQPNGYINPSNPLDLTNYRTVAGGRPESWRVDSRFDYRFTQNDSVYVNFNKSRGQTNPYGGIQPQMPGSVDDRSYLVTANYAHVFTPAMTNEFIFAVGKGTMFSLDQGTVDYMHRTDTLRNKYFQNIGSGADLGIYAMSISGLSTIGEGESFMASNPTLQFSDNANWVHGKHQFKFGASYFKKTEHDWDFIRSVSFDNTFSEGGTVQGSLGGDGAASFLMGLPTTINQRYNITGGNDDLNFVMPYWAAFADDKYQITSNLTLTIGVRWELPIFEYSPISYGNGTMDFSYPGWQLKIPGRASGVPLHITPAPKKDFAPRVGLAYRLGHNMVVRASFGIFYDAGNSNSSESALNYAFGAVPGYVSDTFNNARYNANQYVPFLTWPQIFPAEESFTVGTYPVSTGVGTGYFGGATSVHVQDQNSGRTPYYFRSMIQVQKTFGADTTVTASFNDGQGRELYYYEYWNQAPYQTGPWPTTTAFNNNRPNNIGRFLDVDTLRHGLNSFYNSGTIQVERRLHRGLQFVSHYTFSKTVADGNARYFRKLTRGEASYSHPHRFIAGLTYDLPWGETLPSLAKAALWGWRISSITTFESGNALSLGNSLTSARDQETNRPNVTCDPNLPRGDRTFYEYFNTGCVYAPPNNVKGNAGVGTVRGPGMNNWDMTLSKTFKPLERLKTEFRADLYNMFNHAQWSGVNTTYTNAPGNTFGRVTGAREPRIMQLGLRLLF